MSLRDLIARLTGAGASAAADAPFPPQIEALVAELCNLVAQEIEPALVSLPRYRARIEPSVRRTIAHLRNTGTLFQYDAIELSAAAWSRCTEINTLFATPADVTTTLAHSDDLQRWFREHPDATEACAWLGAERQERNVLGMALVGDAVQRDVLQTTLSFTQHKVVFPAADSGAARIELGLAIFRGLLGVVLERIEAARDRSRSLAEQQAIMKVRLRRLRQQQQSIAQFADHGDSRSAIAALEQELAKTGAALQESKLQFSTLDTYLAETQQVLDRPAEVLDVVTIPVRVDRMGVQVGADAGGPVNEMSVVEIRAQTLRRVALLVRCRRADLPPAAKAKYESYV